MIFRKETRKASVEIVKMDNGNPIKSVEVVDISPRTKSVINAVKNVFGEDIIVNILEEYTETTTYDVPLDVLENYIVREEV